MIGVNDFGAVDKKTPVMSTICDFDPVKRLSD